LLRRADWLGLHVSGRKAHRKHIKAGAPAWYVP
jgi:hypothetical protein